MKTLTLLLLSALFGVAVHIQTSAPQPVPVELATVSEWPTQLPFNVATSPPNCSSRGPALFAWWPVADYFVRSAVVSSSVADPVFVQTRRCF